MNRASLAVLIVCLSACSAPEKYKAQIVDGHPENILIDLSKIPDAVPRYEHWSASVNPKSYKVLGKTYHVLRSNKNYRQQGIASWYGKKFHHKKTATGEVYDMWTMTAAHKTLPIPSYVRVTNLDNHRSVIVRVNDRGPFHAHRIIDLSFAAATRLDIVKAGTGFVDVMAIQPSDKLADTNAASAQKIFYQIGAFATRDNALLLQEKIRAGDFSVSRIVVDEAAGSKLFKLQIGPIASVSEADNISKKLKQIGIYNGHYIAE